MLPSHTNAIDLLWRGKLLVEHKSFGQSLDAAETQAFGYIEDLTREGRFDEIPRFVLVSDFAHFVLYDLESGEQRDLPLFAGRPSTRVSFTLNDFPRHIRAFAFMLGQTRVRLDPEDPANQKAYARMCELHDALKTGGFTGHELERLLVRILFCMFAEDTGIFEPESFSQFIRNRTREDGSDLGAELNLLFDWLNNPQADTTLDDTDPLYGFRYVNGDLFAERLGFPRCTREMRAALLYCCEFQWARISPAVFGSLFQGVLDDKARRQQGAHYTSERDIMKVLRSLFLDQLRAEFEQFQHDRSSRRRANLEVFQQKLRSLKFLDPACGCGNFLVLGYRELRLLEMEIVRTLHGAEQQVLDVRQLLKVDVDQFYGIELSEWPARIAEVALWLMDHQMNGQAAEAFGQGFDRLPLRSSPHVVQGNALRMDWNSVLPREQCAFVMGNPPFVGKKERNAEQKADMEIVWGETKGTGVLDYVTAWYVTAARYCDRARIPVAFVSTNSISQGEQAGILWAELFQRWHLKIHFAHRSFPWQSEAQGAAHVHVVIIGFGAFDQPRKRIYDYDQGEEHVTVTEVANINPYLIAASDVTVRTRTEPINGAPPISYGSMMIDKDRAAGDEAGLILTREHRDALLAECPALQPFIRVLYGGDEFLNGIERWCLWLVDAPPQLLRQSALLRERIETVRQFREASGREQTRKLAATPALFGEIRQPAACLHCLGGAFRCGCFARRTVARPGAGNPSTDFLRFPVGAGRLFRWKPGKQGVCGHFSGAMALFVLKSACLEHASHDSCQESQCSKQESACSDQEFQNSSQESRYSCLVQTGSWLEYRRFWQVCRDGWLFFADSMMGFCGSWLKTSDWPSEHGGQKQGCLELMSFSRKKRGEYDTDPSKGTAGDPASGKDGSSPQWVGDSVAGVDSATAGPRVSPRPENRPTVHRRPDLRAPP